MSESMDAEDVRTMMNALWRQVDQCILDHNGRIDKHIGDAVMALWGVDESRVMRMLRPFRRERQTS